MPENKDSVQDVEETSAKDSASIASSDYQENVEEKNKKDCQKENKEQKNTRIIKKIIKGTKKEKNSSAKFEEGISFRGKLIGVEDVKDARGDKICQDSLQRLKAAVKSAGEHKQKIIMSVSFQGIKITSEKSNEVIYHHPVHMISFTSLDINDGRAFGYICGTADEGHKFVAIKTEKAACQVVLTLQDLFQAVLEKKKQAMESAKKFQSKVEKKDEVDNQASEEKPPGNEKTKIQEEASQEKQDSITANLAVSASAETETTFQAYVPTPPPIQSNIDDLLCLQLEVDQLQEGIAQMDNSMAAIGVTPEPFYDPFNTSTFALIPQAKDVFESTTTCSTTSSNDEQSAKSQTEESPQISPEIQETSSFYITYNGNDKYSAFTKIDTIPSIFETSQVLNVTTTNVDDTTTCTFDAFGSVENTDKVPPPKPVRSPPKEDNLFADLDPLGKDRPFLDKKDFFYDLKNPPKKLLKDLVDRPQSSEGSTFYTSAQSAPESTEVSRTYQSSDVCPPFPCDFSNVSPPQVPPRSADVLSSSLPSTSILQRVACDDTKKGSPPAQTVSPFNPFSNTIPILSPPPLPPRLSTRASEPSIKVSAIAVKSEFPSNAISSSPNMLLNAVSNQRRGSLPLTQLQPDIVYQDNAFVNDANNNNNIAINSSHPIPIPARKLTTNFQRNSFNSCNGQSLDNEHNKNPNSLEAESPPITDYFGHNLSEAMTNSTKSVGSTSRDRPMLKQCNRTSSCVMPETHLMNGTSPHTRSVGIISLSPEESQSAWAHAVNDKNGLMNGDNTIPLYEQFPDEYTSQSMEHGQKLNGVSSCAKSTKFCSNSASVFSSGSIFSRKLDPFADDFFAAPKKFNDYQRVPNEL